MKISTVFFSYSNGFVLKPVLNIKKDCNPALYIATENIYICKTVLRLLECSL